MDDLSKIFGSNVSETSDVTAKSYFIKWTQEDKDTVTAGQMAHLAFCGFVDGKTRHTKFILAKRK